MASPSKIFPVVDITSLKEGDIGWKIEARCTRKTKIIPFESGGKKGTRMSMDFEDDSGKISAVIFNNGVKELDRLVEMGKKYSIDKAVVKKPFGNKAVLGYHLAELTLFSHTNVVLIDDGPAFVPKLDIFSKLVHVDDGTVALDAVINIVAVVESVGASKEVAFKNKDGTVRKSSCVAVQLLDSSLVETVSATFWGAASAEMVNRKGSVVQLKGVEVVKREGRVALNGTARTEIEFDSKDVSATTLQQWYKDRK